ncbi:TIGR00730 family Rossman fold protein [Histidinibacterium lentulum]|uniref:Cytokinin riboside 5'-monophosphate phosphoribohydrolase n=1 Tax=Histidinibacterium lentulum TaxID=2480588 RepID=A0A3N2R5Q4_9RHOB|nr:TIGR00730 family Rossman fold protein [Histidinibacterium lentulum]ROU02764.1 TIGR00730 family Rossman fold protein [Histidinibacterium lentulum]
MDDKHRHPLRDSRLDRTTAEHRQATPQALSPTYRLAFDDPDFLTRPELRPVRLQLELLKPELAMDEAGIVSTIVLFGGARIPEPSRRDTARTETLAELSRYYDQARRFARMVTERSVASGGGADVIVTGGGPGVMEAGNRGAEDAGGRSIGLGIVLPHEQSPNPYITPELSFNFHYFAIRKMHFLMRARAICVFPGGFGTMDELFESLTLIQTGRMERVPVLLFGRPFWERIVNWEALADAGTISPEDLELFRYVETAEEALEAIDTWEGAGQRRVVIPGR